MKEQFNYIFELKIIFSKEENQKQGPLKRSDVK